MSITITGDLVNEHEQIKKKSRTINITESISKSVKDILDKDEFDFFNTKTKNTLSQKIVSTEATIEKLIDLKVTAVTHGKTMKVVYKDLVTENNKLKNKINQELG